MRKPPRVNVPILALRAITLVFLVVGMLLCVFALPSFGSEAAALSPVYGFFRIPSVVGLYAAVLCLFAGLAHFWSLLGGLAQNGALSAKRLKGIRFCALLFAALYLVCVLPAAALIADAEGAPGLVLMWAFPALLPGGIAAFAALPERVGRGAAEER